MTTPPQYLEDEAGCWIWQGYADKNGYGRAYNRERRAIFWAHRHFYELHKGPIPAKYEIDHMCQVTLCVNPDHLQALTKAEHARVTMQRLGKDDLHAAAAVMRRRGYTYAEIADALEYSSEGSAFAAVRAAVEKGLVDPDEVPPSPRLNEAEREEIRVLYEMGVPQVVLGRFYGVDGSQVSRVCSGYTSGHSKAKEAC